MEARQTATTSEKLNQLHQIINQLLEAEMELRYRLQVPVDDYFYKKIDEWASKILGVSSGYENEFKLMYRHRVEKLRHLAGGHADVTIGEDDDFFAKSIQSKVTTGDFSAVNSMLKEAFNQLSGERGEQPRENDRLVVSMVINNANNTWPDGANTLGTLDFNQFKDRAISKLHELVMTYRPHLVTPKTKTQPAQKQVGFGMSPVMFHSMTDMSQQQVNPIQQFPYMGFPGSSQLTTHSHGLHPSQGEKAIHLTIKIEYLRGFPIKTGVNLQSGQPIYIFLHKAVFNGVRIGDKLVLKLHKYTAFNGHGFFKTVL